MIPNMTNSELKTKLFILQKNIVAQYQSRYSPVYLINEYPKSGGTWLKMMLAEALSTPAWTKGRPVFAPCVMQAHWIKQAGRCRTIALYRDGRDVMVSYYYHALFRNDMGNEKLVKLIRHECKFQDIEDIKSNLIKFMKIMFDKPISPRFSWLDFVNYWTGKPNVISCRYEDLRNDTSRTLINLYESLCGLPLCENRAIDIANAYTMENMRRRKIELNPGIVLQKNPEINFIRKGTVGGWSEHFSDDALEWFEKRAGTALDLLGYKRGRPQNT